MGFSKDFLWGAATAAYQIEGAANEDGRGPSIWDTFSHTPGNIKNGDTGDVACNHYHHYKEDVALMAEIGLQAYRFSISWPRVLPEGTGAANEKGLDFYDRLVDELLAKNIQPCATLFHWDMPQALYDRGSWRNPDIAEYFAEYAGLMARRLGDRIPCWMTFNEMCVVINCGHVPNSFHAPGEELDRTGALKVLKGMLLSHGRGVEALRAALPKTAQIGLAHCGVMNFPASDSAEDVEATRQSMFGVPDDNGSDLHSAGIYLDPVFFGKYTDDVLTYFGEDVPPLSPEEGTLISQPIDFLGINLYWGRCVGAGADGKPETRPHEPLGYTDFDWPITPEALYWSVTLMHERYGVPIMITENGMSNDDRVDANGKVHDKERIEFLSSYLRELRRAADEGVPLLGYMQWSLMDNFEWAEGCSQRFGLIHIDYETQKRTPKDSALWYKGVIESNGENL